MNAPSNDDLDLDYNLDVTGASHADTIATLRAGRTSHPKFRITQDGDDFASIRIATADDAALTEDEEIAEAIRRGTAFVPPGRIRDELRQIDTRAAWLVERLGAGAYNQQTGAWESAVRPDLRASFEAELKGLKATRSASEKALLAAEEAEKMRAERQQQLDEAEDVELEFHGHDQRRKALLNDAMEKIQAEIVARRVLAKRYGLTDE